MKDVLSMQPNAKNGTESAMIDVLSMQPSTKNCAENKPLSVYANKRKRG